MLKSNRFAAKLLVVIITIVQTNLVASYLVPTKFSQCRLTLQPLHHHSNSNPKLRWYTCASTPGLTNAISSLLQPDDHVVELGSQLREVSRTIINTTTTGSALFLDVQRAFPADTTTKRTQAMRLATASSSSPLRERDEFVELQRMDDWKSVVAARDGATSLFTVLVLDINSMVGNDLDWTSFSIAKEFCGLVPTCRMVLVKSKLLHHQWATRIRHGDQWIEQQQQQQQQRTTRPQNNNSPKIIATVGVKQYRRTIPYTVRDGDSVLEVGCHFGTTTALLHTAAAGTVLGVDVGARIIQAARRRHPHVSFAVGDAWRTAHLLRLQQQQQQSADTTIKKRVGFDVIYVDIGGLSGDNGLLEALVLLQSLQCALEPRCIVIKSACMQQLSRTLVPYEWRSHHEYSAK